jgi:N-acetylmuramoyl-L-alanine amidase
MKVYNKRYFNSTCHTVEFLPTELRLEDTPGIPGKREHISRIFGNPHLDEVVWLRVNRAFFNMSDPKSEAMGDGLGDSFINAGYKSGKIYFEPYIPEEPEWSVGTSYMLLRGSEYSYDNEDRFKDILGKNPRTFFGQVADGTIKFIAADGRRWPLEQGLSSNEQRSVAKEEKLHDAANLDGGGSSVIMVGDEIINKSYDGRGLGNIFVGYRKYTLDELKALATFKDGSQGVWVHLLQRLLNKAGFDCGLADGIFGQKTRWAVVEFQRRKKLTIDGLVGPQTWESLTEKIISEKKLPTLIIDPGHGGTDPGAVYAGYVEKDINLVVAKRVRELLKDFNPDITRETDITLDSGPRTAKIKDKYDYCLSVHFNANAGSRTEAIHSIYSERGKKLAESICKELAQTLGLPQRVFCREGQAGDYYFMHRLTGSTTTVIVECLPLDTEYGKLHIENIAQAVARGFKNFVGP